MISILKFYEKYFDTKLLSNYVERSFCFNFFNRNLSLSDYAALVREKRLGITFFT